MTSILKTQCRATTFSLSLLKSFRTGEDAQKISSRIKYKMEQ
jgi:hypothetical protein